MTKNNECDKSEEKKGSVGRPKIEYNSAKLSANYFYKMYRIFFHIAGCDFFFPSFIQSLSLPRQKLSIIVEITWDKKKTGRFCQGLYLLKVPLFAFSFLMKQTNERFYFCFFFRREKYIYSSATRRGKKTTNIFWLNKEERKITGHFLSILRNPQQKARKKCFCEWKAKNSIVGNCYTNIWK